MPFMRGTLISGITIRTTSVDANAPNEAPCPINVSSYTQFTSSPFQVAISSSSLRPTPCPRLRAVGGQLHDALILELREDALRPQDRELARRPELIRARLVAENC